MHWRDLVRSEIHRLVALRGAEEFTRDALKELSIEVFERAFPNAQTPEQTMSRVLQELRDGGELEFVRPGVYRVLFDELPTRLDGARGAAVPAHGEFRSWARQEVATRPYQKWLRRHVLPNFGHACAICGLSPEWFLDAAHLRPVALFHELASSPAAAIALCKNHHAAHDVGAFSIRADLHIAVHHDALRPLVDEAKRIVLAWEGRSIRTPLHYELMRDALPSEGGNSAGA